MDRVERLSVILKLLVVLVVAVLGGLIGRGLAGEWLGGCLIFAMLGLLGILMMVIAPG